MNTSAILTAVATFFKELIKPFIAPVTAWIAAKAQARADQAEHEHKVSEADNAILQKQRDDIVHNVDDAIKLHEQKTGSGNK